MIFFFRKVLHIWVSFYLDDLLVQNLDPMELQGQAQAMTVVLHLLGFRVNLKKSDLEPSRRITHLGFVFDTSDMTVSLPDSKVESIRRLVSGTIKRGSAMVTHRGRKYLKLPGQNKMKLRTA